MSLLPPPGPQRRRLFVLLGDQRRFSDSWQEQTDKAQRREDQLRSAYDGESKWRCELGQRIDRAIQVLKAEDADDE